MIKLKDLISEKKNPFPKESPAYEPWEKKYGKKKKNEGGPGSGPHGDDEDNPFDREPSDDELKDIEKQFEGTVFEGIDLYQEACWKGYTQKGMKTMFGKQYPNCVKATKKKKSESKINEVGISVSSKPFQAWSEHSDYIRKLNRDSMWAAKSFPNKKKEAKAIQKYTQELYKLIEIIKGQAIDL